MTPPESNPPTNPPHDSAVEMLYRPAALLSMRPKTRGTYTQHRNVVYAEACGAGLIMDVFYPLRNASGSAVVDVIGSGWMADRIALNEHIGLGAVDALCDRGLTVFAVSPGSVTLFTGLQMVHHVHAALRHIKHHGADYGIHPRRIGILGASAGGHLAAMAALTPQPGHPAARPPLRRWATDVAAVAVLFPPTDLVEYGSARFDQIQVEGFDPGRLLFRDGLDGKSEAEVLEKLTALSPARLPVATPPPFMIVQGKKDLIVPWKQAEKLAAALRRAGGLATVRYHETGGHPWPDIHKDIGDMACWLDERLGAVPA